LFSRQPHGGFVTVTPAPTLSVNVLKNTLPKFFSTRSFSPACAGAAAASRASSPARAAAGGEA
jgi:hypothetical protein